MIERTLIGPYFIAPRCFSTRIVESAWDGERYGVLDEEKVRNVLLYIVDYFKPAIELSCGPYDKEQAVDIVYDTKQGPRRWFFRKIPFYVETGGFAGLRQRILPHAIKKMEDYLKYGKRYWGYFRPCFHAAIITPEEIPLKLYSGHDDDHRPTSPAGGVLDIPVLKAVYKPRSIPDCRYYRRAARRELLTT